MEAQSKKGREFLSHPSTRLTIRWLKEGEATIYELAERIDITPNAIGKIVKRLRDLKKVHIRYWQTNKDYINVKIPCYAWGNKPDAEKPPPLTREEKTGRALKSRDREKHIQANRAYRERNKDAINAKARAKRNANLEAARAKWRRYYQNNKEQYLSRQNLKRALLKFQKDTQTVSSVSVEKEQPTSSSTTPTSTDSLQSLSKTLRISGLWNSEMHKDIG